MLNSFSFKSMNIFSTKNEVRNYWEQLKREGKKIGFVPT
ncbi:MAG: pantothenate synthetase, partial [Spirosomataceae bacterium]